MKIRTVLFLCVCLMAGAVPAAAQSNATYSITAGDQRFDLTGGVLIIELTNIAEEFYLASLSLDEKMMAEQLQTSTMMIEAISPPEKNNSGTPTTRKSETTTTTYPTNDGGTVVVEITTRSDGTTTTTEIEITTTKKDEGGNTTSDTIEIIISPYEPPIIRAH